MTAVYYVLRYRPDTDLGRRFPAWTIATWATREDAERVRLACPNAEKIEVVEVARKALQTRRSEPAVWDNRNGSDRGVSAPQPEPDHLSAYTERG